MIMIVDMGIQKHTLNKRKHDVYIIMTMTTSKWIKEFQTLLLIDEIDILCKLIFLKKINDE